MRWIGMALAAALTLACGPARADMIYSLIGVTFADGGRASGYLEINVYGFLSTYDIVTTPGAGTFGAGYEYASPGTPASLGAGDTRLIFSRLSYVGGLSLSLSDPLSSLPYVDPIAVGDQSFECDTFLSNTNSCSAANQRLVTAGVLMPEPASVAMLGAGLAVLGLRLRRRAS